jgi:hypothetical protein
MPTVRQIETPTVKTAADVEATRVQGAPAIAPPTQVAARTAVAPPPPPRTARAATPVATPAPAKRSALPVLALVAVLGLGFLTVGGVGAWYLFLRKPAPVAPTPDNGPAATPQPGVEVASSSSSGSATPPAAQGLETPAPAETGVPATTPAVSSASGERVTPPPRVASGGETVPRPTPPPNTAVGGASEGRSNPDYSFLDEEVDQQPDGRESGRRVAEQFSSGRSSQGGSFGTQNRLRMRARSPQARNVAERSAIATMRFLMNTEERFNKRTGRYGTLAEIGAGMTQYLDVQFQPRSFQRRGYRFNLTAERDSFSLTASPLAPGLRSFVGDDSGYIREAEE